MFKRLVVAASVSAVAMLGFVPAASASTPTSTAVVSLQPAKFKVSKAIDRDAPPASGITVQRVIDWD